MKEIIVLKQAPIISYDKVKEVGEKVQQRIAQLDLENQIITEQTKQTAKNTRAELSKEFKIFEDQRKFIKEQVLAPYDEFEQQYKEFIATHYKQADDVLKTKISFFENQLKEEKIQRAKAFFNELCQAHQIDFLRFEKVGISATLSASEKSIREKIENFVIQVAKDVALIQCVPEDDAYKSEVLTEYKNSLNAGRSFQIVKERKQAQAEQLARIEAQQKEVLQAPKVVELPQEAPVFELSFRVKGTKQQLKALKTYIISNNIELL